jgi:endonuclease/exonuclease/phosphatase family metal-dependent hydrolase
MKIKFKFIIPVLIIIIGAISLVFINDIAPEEIINPVINTSFTIKEISLLSFNIQIFGLSKISNKEVVNVLVDIISKYDLIAIQEVRDSSGQAVVDFMKLLDSRYSYFLGPREGRSSSKEQYWFIYDKTKLKIISQATYPDLLNTFERRPEAVYFEYVDGGFDFILINKHVSPGDALKEISYIPKLFDYFYDLFKDPDIIIVGDFNADGNYFDESILTQIFPVNMFSIIIDNSIDTTIGLGNNTYDRIIISSSSVEDFTGKYGVYIFEDYYDFSTLGIQSKQVSDHYPVWATFYIGKDTD